MRHLIFEPSPRFPIAILIKPQQLRKADLEKHYITPTGLGKRMFIAFDLDYNGKKAPVSLQKEYLNQVLPELCNLRTEYILCTDTAYFKTLTRKLNPTMGMYFHVQSLGLSISMSFFALTMVSYSMTHLYKAKLT